MRTGALVVSVCSRGGRFQKTHDGEPRKDGRPEKGGGLPSGKPLNICNQLVEISPTESIRYGADLVGGEAHVLGRLRHFCATLCQEV